MSKARNISNLFSSNTDITTDAELNTHATAANGHIGRGGTSSRPGSATQGDTYFNTDLGLLEVYDTGRWTTANSAPVAPTSVVATNQPTSRAFNNGQASIAFTAPTTGGRVNTYTVTSSPGSYTASGSSSPLVITGLQSSTQYTYSITSTNGVGTSTASESSSGVTATTVPQAPTIGTATGADSSATLTFTAGSTGGATISNYKYSTDNSTYSAFSPAQTTSPLTISGLTNGNSYAFYLKAVNANGDSSASDASNTAAVGPMGAFESIATTNVGAGGATTVTFSSIPSTYKHLQIRGIARTNRDGVTLENISMVFNSDSISGNTNYTFHAIDGDGASASSFAGTSFTRQIPALITSSAAGANIFGAFIIDIADYADTNKYKTVRSLNGADINGSGGSMRLTSGMYMQTAAISTIKMAFTIGGGAFNQYSSIALYGIKG